LITACPNCGTRYRIAPEKVGPNGARLRCKKCENVFRVEPPREVEPEPQAAAERAPLARALVAEPDADLAKKISFFLARWRIESDVVHDGEAALLRLFRDAPKLAVLGAGLPGVSAPAVCEIARRAKLAGVALVRAVGEGETAPPDFDADHTLERDDLPGGLGGMLAPLGIGEPPPQAPASKPAPPPPAAPKPAASAPPPPAPSDDPQVAAAERLARIIVSDIILYNEEKFATAALAGNAAAALAEEIDEARALFGQRVPEALRAARDFLIEELERRAAAFGA
jgi:predicted Zn finger-like uncharacterized protein